MSKRKELYEYKLRQCRKSIIVVFVEKILSAVNSTMTVDMVGVATRVVPTFQQTRGE